MLVPTTMIGGMKDGYNIRINKKKALTKDEMIQELMDMLKQNNMQSQSNDVFEICSYVDGLEKKLDAMTEELTSVRAQIKEMQEIRFLII